MKNINPIKMRIFFFITLIFLSLNIFAQTNDELHLSSLKEATIFLGKAQKKSINVNDIEKCKSVDELKKSGVLIDGLNNKLNSWDNIQNIKKLKEQIINDLTTGDKDKEQRKENFEKDYTRLTTKLDQYVAQSETKDNSSDVEKPDPKDNPPIEKESEESKVNQTAGVAKSNKLVFFLPYILILFLFAFSFFLFDKIKEIKQQVKNIESEFKKNMDNKDSESSVASLSAEVKKITGKLNEIILERNNLNTQTKQNVVELSIKPEEMQQPQVETIIRYAKSSTNGGFSSIDLKQKQNNECIFELHITGNKAKLKLSEESKVQQYALSENPDYYFKSDVCTIQGIPASDKKIIVNHDGELELNNDKSKWNIIKPINITFS